MLTFRNKRIRNKNELSTLFVFLLKYNKKKKWLQTMKSVVMYTVLKGTPEYKMDQRKFSKANQIVFSKIKSEMVFPFRNS